MDLLKIVALLLFFLPQNTRRYGKCSELSRWRKKGKPGLYLLYPGALYVSQDDESVRVLHHVGGQPTLTFVPRMKSFSQLAVCPDSLPAPLLPSLE